MNSLNYNKNTKNNKIILSILEDERQRIARDLHDETLQDLTHIVHQLELFGLYMESDPLKANIELLSIKQGIKSCIEEIRNIIFNLRPMSFDDLGLKDTFELLFDKLRQTTKFDFVTEIDDIVTDNQIILLYIYRMTVECVSNAIKHSNGSKICFTCKSIDNNCFLIIEDNGNGFNKEEIQMNSKHFGLSILYERVNMLNGDITIDTNQNGTRISIVIPLIEYNS